MAVKKKAEKAQETVSHQAIEEIINRGGEVSRDNWDKMDKTQPEDIRFTLRLPKEILDKIDRKRKERPGKISRNQWILDKIIEHLE